MKKEKQLILEIEKLQNKITELKKIEIKQKEAETDLRSLFNAMTDIVLEMDYQGKYLSIAPTSPNLLYKPPADTIGKTLHDIFPKSEADKFLKFVQKCLDDNKSYSIEYPLVINNETLWFEGRAVPKTRNSILYIARDITERKMAEELLKQNEEKYRNIITNLMEGFYSVTLDGILLDYNPEFIKILGLNINEDYKGMKSPDFWQNPAERQVYIDEFMKNGFVRNYIINAKKSNGEKIILQANSRLISNINGEPQRIEGVLLDITDRKQAEDKLKATNQQLRASEQQLRAANQQLSANEQQLRASNQQLSANEQQLRAANQQLTATEQQLRAANQQLKANEISLKKRLRELEIFNESTVNREVLINEYRKEINELLGQMGKEKKYDIVE